MWCIIWLELLFFFYNLSSNSAKRRTNVNKKCHTCERRTSPIYAKQMKSFFVEPRYNYGCLLCKSSLISSNLTRIWINISNNLALLIRLNFKFDLEILQLGFIFVQPPDKYDNCIVKSYKFSCHHIDFNHSLKTKNSDSIRFGVWLDKLQVNQRNF